MTPPESPVNPPHYRHGEIECIDAIRAAMTPEEFAGYCKGNALKYLWRAGRKGGPEQAVEDIRKAQWYLTWLAGNDPRTTAP